MESQLQKSVVKYAKKQGLRASKFVDQSRIGAPDLMIWYPEARILFIETKFDINGPSAHQIEYHRLLRAEGHVVFCLNDLAKIKRAIYYFAKNQT